MNGRLDGGPQNIMPPSVLLVQKSKVLATCGVFSERELTFAICHRPSVSSVTFVRPAQTIEIFGNVSALFGTLCCVCCVCLVELRMNDNELQSRLLILLIT